MANGEVIITAANKAIMLGRLNAMELGGGEFSTPSQKSAEIANVLDELITAVDDT